jgi:hypothetical protein
MLSFNLVAFGTRPTRRSIAAGYITEWTRTSAPRARRTRLSDGAVSPDMTIDRTRPQSPGIFDG